MISAGAPGYLTNEVKRDLAIGKGGEVEITLARATGVLVIDVDDPRAVVSIDGKPVGTGRFEGPVPVGTRAIVVRVDDKVVHASDVDMRLDQRRTLFIHVGGTPWGWIAGGVLGAAAIGAGAFLLFRPKDPGPQPTPGTISPGVLQLP